MQWRAMIILRRSLKISDIISFLERYSSAPEALLAPLNTLLQCGRASGREILIVKVLVMLAETSFGYFQEVYS
jgi:hypothetical protein